MLLAVGCSENPSFEMRWQISPTPGAEAAELKTAGQCAEVGIGQIQVASKQDGVTIDLRNYPCYPVDFEDAGGVLPGPELPDGDYRLEFTALGQAGQTWDELEPEVREVTVSGSSALQITDLAFDAPPPCNDGIDNDSDGLVDSHDPSCRLTASGREDTDTTLTTFFVNQRLLGGYTPCYAVGLAKLELKLLDMGNEPIHIPVEVACTALGTSSVGVRLPQNPEGCTADCYTWEATGVDSSGTPVTATKTGTFGVTPDQNGLVSLDVALDGSDFIDPISSPLEFSLNFISNDVVGARGCTPPNQNKAGILEVNSIELTFFDANMSEVDLVDADGMAFSNECPAGVLTTELLDQWGVYYVQAEGLSAEGEVCFSNAQDPAPASAHTLFSISLPRAPGDLPPSCVDCQTDADCGSCQNCCIEGICR